MANNLCLAVSKNVETFKESRIYILGLTKSKEALIKLENAEPRYILHHYITFIESKGVCFLEALIYYNYQLPNLAYHDLVTIAVINIFKKIENNDYNYIPF